MVPPQEAELDLGLLTNAFRIRGDGRTEPPRPPVEVIAPQLSTSFTGSGGDRTIGTGGFASAYRTAGISEDQTPTGPVASQTSTKPQGTIAASGRSPKGAVRVKSGCFTCRIRQKVSERFTQWLHLLTVLHYMFRKEEITLRTSVKHAIASGSSILGLVTNSLSGSGYVDPASKRRRFHTKRLIKTGRSRRA